MSKNKELKFDDRFWQLHTLATEGSEEAQADLWAEYEFAYGSDEAPVTDERLIHAVPKATQEAKEKAHSQFLKAAPNLLPYF